MATDLILVDIQNEYFPGGRMELSGIDRASANAREVLTLFRYKGWPTIHVQHVSAHADAPLFTPSSRYVELHESVRPLAGERVIRKHFPNSFHQTPLLEELKSRGVDTAVIVGAMSHMCIDATTRAAYDLGLKCVLLHDACAMRDSEFQGKRVAADEVHASFMAALGWWYADVKGMSEYLASAQRSPKS